MLEIRRRTGFQQSSLVLNRKYFNFFRYFLALSICHCVVRRNCYDVGLVANAADIFDPVRHDFWPGPVTDAFCEDMLLYRRVDLRPTIVIPALDAA
jgi:hypothetical protein